jgi:hypothetical protein
MIVCRDPGIRKALRYAFDRAAWSCCFTARRSMLPIFLDEAAEIHTTIMAVMVPKICGMKRDAGTLQTEEKRNVERAQPLNFRFLVLDNFG